MRKALILILALAFVLAMAGTAVAAPLDDWNPPGPTYRDPVLPPDPNADTPHGSYSSTGDECEICHSPHQAGSGGVSYKLLRAADRADACDYCHIGAGAKTAKVVYGAGKTGNHGHEIEAFTGGVPDSDGTVNIGSELDCFDCHSTHGAKAIASKILKKDPGNNGGTDAADKHTTFCADCHNKNHDTASGGDSHIMTATVGDHSNNPTNQCNHCHTASGDYPHTSDGVALLKNGVTRDAMDAVCYEDCHSDVGKTVGVDY